VSSAAGLVAREPTHSALRRDEILSARGVQHPAGKPYSRSTYVNHRCRCERCTEANALYTQHLRGQPPRTRLSRTMLKVRNAERRRRENLAASRARAELARLHADEYRVLLGVERVRVDAEAGPLPGDPT
jgi:hypothetical protein